MNWQEIGEGTGQGNFIGDPLFCGTPGSGDYRLQSVSPCAPENHPQDFKCGLIGLLPVACGSGATQPCSWSTVKAFYHPW